MAITIARVKKGDPLKIPADAYNLMADTAEKYLSSEARFAAGSIALGVTNGSVIRVRNATAADRNRFDVANLAAPVFSPGTALDAFSAEVIMTGTFAGITGPKTVCVFLEPVASGQVGLARVAGVMPVRIRVRQLWHRYARIVYGHDCFDSDGAGPVRLMWVASEPLTSYAQIGDDVRPAYAMLNVETQLSLRGTYLPSTIEDVDMDGEVLVDEMLNWIPEWDESADPRVVMEGDESECPWLAETYGMLTPAAPFGKGFCEDTAVEVTWQPYYQQWAYTAAHCPPEGGCEESSSSLGGA